MHSSHSSFRLQSLIDPVSLESITDPIRFEPCYHIFDSTTADLFPLNTGKCPCCRNLILGKVRDVTIKKIIDLLDQINKHAEGSKEQIRSAGDLGRCVLSPLIYSNRCFEKPVRLIPCECVIEASLANKLTNCPVKYCKKNIESTQNDFMIKSLVDEVREVSHSIRLKSRVAKKEVVAAHFDNDITLMEIAEGILLNGGSVEKLTIDDHSSVTDFGFRSFIEKFSDTIKDVRITFSPPGLSKDIFEPLRCIKLDNLCLIGSRSLVDVDVVALLSTMKLKSLNLQGCGVTGDCLPYLKQMTTVKSLALNKSSFNSLELKELQAALPEARFYFL